MFKSSLGSRRVAGCVLALLLGCVFSLRDGIAGEAAPFKFIVPVHLKNMPNEVQYIVLHWALMDEFLEVLAEDRVFVKVKLNDFGDAEGVFPLEIKASQVDDPGKVASFIVSLELSEDGSSSYAPDSPGEHWTKSYPGTKPVKYLVYGKKGTTWKKAF